MRLEKNTVDRAVDRGRPSYRDLRKPTNSSMALVLILVFALLICPSTSSLAKDAIIMEALLPNPEAQTIGALKSYSLGGRGTESGMSITCDHNGSCLLFGETKGSFGSTVDYFAAKISTDQKIIWAKTYGGYNDDRALSLVPTLDGGYLLAGVSNSMLFTFRFLQSSDKGLYPLIIKIDSSGNVVWAKAIEYLTAPDFGIFSAIQTSDKGYVLSGYCQTKDRQDCNVLLKLSEGGDLLWSNCYSLSGGTETYQYRVAENAKQNLAVLFDAGKDKVGLFLSDSQGKPLWTRTFKGEDSLTIRTEGIMSDKNDDYTLIAANLSGGDEAKGTVELAAIRTNSQGDLLWSRQYTLGRVNIPSAVVSGPNNDTLIAGITGEGALSFRYGGRLIRPVNAFAVLIDDNGKVKSGFVTASDTTNTARSVSGALDKYFLVGEVFSTTQKPKASLLAYQPRRESTDNGALFSQLPFKVQAEAAIMETTPLKLDSIDVKKVLNVNKLAITDPTKWP